MGRYPTVAKKGRNPTSMFLSQQTKRQLQDLVRTRGGTQAMHFSIAIDRYYRDPDVTVGETLEGLMIRLLWADVLMPYDPSKLLDIDHHASAREYATLLKGCVERAAGVDCAVQIDMTQPATPTNYGLFAVLTDLDTGAQKTVRAEDVPYELTEPVLQAQAEMRAHFLTGEWIVRKGDQ